MIENKITEAAELFKRIDEPYLEGLFERADDEPVIRFANAHRRYLEESELPHYQGGEIYPSGANCPRRYAFFPNYSFTVATDYDYLKEKSEEGFEIVEKSGLLPERVDMNIIHTAGGTSFTHSIPNYRRIAKEGFNLYRARVEKMQDTVLKEALLIMLSGIEHYVSRSVQYLKGLMQAAPSNGFSKDRLARIISALERVPFEPAEDIYQALICRNLVLYLDFCDNPGRIDADLYPYYRGEDITGLLEEYFVYSDLNNAWTASIGYDYNELTVQCLKAVKGKRRPQFELMVREDMPEAVWEATEECLMSGCGNPSLYNIELYKKSLMKTFPYIRAEDLERFNGGGCTETMLAGLSNVGSLDAAVNLASIFADYMRGGLATYDTFEGFTDGLMDEIHSTVRTVLLRVNAMQVDRMRHYPNPMRTLLIDDCIDTEKEYNAGGARYCWSVINLAGAVNLFDSMIAVRKLVYEDRIYSREEFADLLEKDDFRLRQLCAKLPCYGNDNDFADGMAKELMDRIIPFFDELVPYNGGKFLPSSIQFTTYTEMGENVAATPDGRKCGAPLCDSMGPLNGKGKEGPTAVLNSVSKLGLDRLLGTPILNLSMQKDFIKKALRPLTLGFMAKGGMHMQISSYSKEDVADAMVHPEKHQDLIVRIGGYTEYFNRLSPELQQTVYERTLHG